MNSKIFLSTNGDRTAFVNKVMSTFSSEFKGKRVYVKPNIVSHELYPTTTHPEVLKAVLEALLDQGCRVRVGDGPALDILRSEQILQNHPLKAVCESLGLELLNLHKTGFKKVTTPSGWNLRVSVPPLESDYLISLPVIKSHCWTDLTGCLKNQFGFFKNWERILMHSKVKSIHRSIAEVNTILKPDLCIADMIETYRIANEKRHGGILITPGCLMAGSDPVAIDCRGLRILQQFDNTLQGKTPEDISYMRHALELGVGRSEREEVDI